MTTDMPRAPRAASDSIPSGTGSGISPRNVTPLPRLCEETSDSDHFRTFARGEASSSSIGTPSAPATLRSTARDGLPTPDSRLAMVERGRPDDVAAAVRFLCGPGARYINGQAIHANGGAYLGS